MRYRVAVVAALVAAPAFGQGERYEVGRHLHAFEVAWDAYDADKAAKKRAAPLVNQAMQSFLKFNLADVAKSLDGARHALESADPVPAAVRWADALQVVPEARMVDAATADLAITVKPFYKTDADAPKSCVLRARIANGKAVEAGLDSLPATLKVPIKDVPGRPSADFVLTAEVVADGKVLATKTVGVSRIEKLAERVEAIKKLGKDLPAAPATIEQATLALLVKQVADLSSGAVPETDYPLSRFVAGAERLTKITEPYYIAKRPGEFWLSVPTGKTPTVIRIRVPEKLEEKKDVPILFALHGMGGSENLFFDAYGNGVVAKLAAERGWLVVAPRVSGLLGGPAPDVPAILDELTKRYPIDPKRVFLIGHSMGAAHVIQLAQRHPGRFAAVAALGGAERLTKPEALKGLPVFVGCGKLDFALPGAKSLHKALEEAKAAVTTRQYDDIEHLTIVREAAADVFKFFDGVAKKN
jgi:predicted esterase